MGSSLQVATWTQLFLLFDFVSSSPLCGAAHQAEILGAGSGAEMTDIEQMKKTVPFVTCETAFGQYVCEMMFGVNVSNLNFWVQLKFCQTTNAKQLCEFLTHVSLWDFGF